MKDEKAADAVVRLTIGGRRAARISRREAMQWVLGAAAASALPGLPGLSGQSAAMADPVGRTPIPQEEAATQPAPNTTAGYGTDPALVPIHKRGAFWPLTLTPDQKRAAAALADVILPRDDYGPAASEVGVVEMVDEWISAPYPQQKTDRPVILSGLAWIDAESAKRFSKPFAELNDARQRAICDDICFTGKATPQFRDAAGFFSRFRSLCAGAYFATPEGWKAIGYVGNVALPDFPGPPPEVLDKLGVTQTVS